MQLKTADHKYSNVLEPIPNPTEIIISPKDRVLIRTNSQLYPKNSVTDILQPSDLLHEKGDITLFPTLVTLNDGNIQITVNNFTDHLLQTQEETSYCQLPRHDTRTNEGCQTCWPSVNLAPTTKWPEHAALYVNSLIKTNRKPQNSESYWLPTYTQRLQETLMNTRPSNDESYVNCKHYENLKALIPQSMQNPGRSSFETLIGRIHPCAWWYSANRLIISGNPWHFCETPIWHRLDWRIRGEIDTYGQFSNLRPMYSSTKQSWGKTYSSFDHATHKWQNYHFHARKMPVQYLRRKNQRGNSEY